jgi:hypothetical protein
MVRKKILLDRALLEKEYWENRLSIRHIASKYKVAKDTINKLLATYGIPVRDPSLTPISSNRKTSK